MAVRWAIDEPGPIRDFIYWTLDQRPKFGASYLVNKTRSALQDHLYFPEDRPGDAAEPERHRIIIAGRDGKPLQYPHDFCDPAAWIQAFEQLTDESSASQSVEASSEFLIDVWTRPLSSNVSERYKGLCAFATLAHDLGRLGVFSVMDVGCSQNAGLNHLSTGAPFEPPVVIRPGSASGKPSIRHTKAFAELLTNDTPFGYGIGIDVYDPKESRSWARSCSHYPSELLNRDRVAFYDNLIMREPDNVWFYRAEFDTFDYDTFAAKQAERGRDNTQYNIVNFSTVLYQASNAEREKMLAHARHIAKEFIVVQDFASINPEQPSQLLFRDNWQDSPFPYRTLIWDMREENPIWHDVFRWRDGRCREMTLGMGRVALENGIASSLWTPLDKRAQAIRLRAG